MSKHDLEKFLHAFIFSRVDYCKIVLMGLPKKTIKRLQLVQNAAARILTKTKRADHITPSPYNGFQKITDSNLNGYYLFTKHLMGGTKLPLRYAPDVHNC